MSRHAPWAHALTSSHAQLYRVHSRIHIIQDMVAVNSNYPPGEDLPTVLAHALPFPTPPEHIWRLRLRIYSMFPN